MIFVAMVAIAEVAILMTFGPSAWMPIAIVLVAGFTEELVTCQ